jgi:urate oxidase
MSSKSRVSFLRKPVHKIPCYQLDCKTILHTRSYNQKYCHKHNWMSNVSKNSKKNRNKYKKDMSSPYGHFTETTKRNCLKCDESFGSTGKFHKLCEPCNLENEFIIRKSKKSGISNFIYDPSFLTITEEMELNSTWKGD